MKHLFLGALEEADQAGSRIQDSWGTWGPIQWPPPLGGGPEVPMGQTGTLDAAPSDGNAEGPSLAPAIWGPERV